jgi:hypothetical protein
VKNSIEVTWGPELYAPLRFHTMTIGPYRMTVTPEDGETDEQAFARGFKFLEAMARKAFATELDAFLKRCKHAKDKGYEASNGEG